MSLSVHSVCSVGRLACWGRRALVVLLCCTLGLHWTVLQGVAWTGMLIGFASEGSMIEAVGKTFDGEHPCPLCKAVKEGQKKEKDDSKPNVAKSGKKFEAVLFAKNRLIAPQSKKTSFAAFLVLQGARFDEVTAPPPRA